MVKRQGHPRTTEHVTGVRNISNGKDSFESLSDM